MESLILGILIFVMACFGMYLYFKNSNDDSSLLLQIEKSKEYKPVVTPMLDDTNTLIVVPSPKITHPSSLSDVLEKQELQAFSVEDSQNIKKLNKIKRTRRKSTTDVGQSNLKPEILIAKSPPTLDKSKPVSKLNSKATLVSKKPKPVIAKF